DVRRLRDIAYGSSYTDAGMVATDASDPNGYSPYTYKVDGMHSSTPTGMDLHIWRNTRIGVVSYELTKTWTDGEMARPAQFGLYTVAADGSKTLALTIDTKADTPKPVTENGYTYEVNTLEAGKKKLLTISNMPKYDANGNLAAYKLEELAIWDESIGDWVSVVDGKAVISGIEYASKLDINASAEGSKGGTKYGELHHSGDITYWNGTNSISRTSDLEFYKVWYDQGYELSDRPVISFNVYRISGKTVIDDEGTKLQEFIKNLPEDPVTAGQVLADEVADLRGAEIVGDHITADKYFDAQNQYLWCIDMDLLPVYDEEGYPYVYYAVETGQSGSEYKESYGNMTAATLSPDTGKTTPEEIYDIEPYSSSAGRNVLILSDGINGIAANNNDPFKYYSRTIVNARQNERTLSGRKVWGIPRGWVIGEADLPQIEFEIYRGVNPIANSTYTNAEFDAWAAVPANKAEKIGTIHLNTGEEKTEERTDGTHYFFKDYRYKIEHLPKYETYGTKYYYYVVERPVPGGTSQIIGYPISDVTYNTNSYFTRNSYSFDEPWAKINGKKIWTVDGKYITDKSQQGIADFVEDMAPVEVSLYVQAADKDGNALPTSQPTFVNKVVIEPDDGSYSYNAVTNTLTVECTFTIYEYADAYDGEIRIPYYGPNGEPFNFYITEAPVNGYDEKVSVKSDGSVQIWQPVKSGEIYQIDRNSFIRKIISGEEIYESYVNDTLFSNTYTGGTTSFTPYKLWDDGYVGNDSYRPDELDLVIKRKVGNTVDSAWSRKVTMKKSENQTVTWKLNETEKAKLTGLEKYAPSGKAYTYFIFSEEAFSVSGTIRTTLGVADAKGDTTGKYTLDGISNTKFTNKLTDSTKLYVEKSWLYVPAEGAAAVSMDWDQFEILRSMDALPLKVQFVVEKSSDNSNWSFVDAQQEGTPGTERHAVSLLGSSSSYRILGYEVDIEHMTKTTFVTDFKNFKESWENLPKQDLDGNELKYRVVEYMEWKTVLSTDPVTYGTEVIKYVGPTKSYNGITGDFVDSVETDGYKTEIDNTVHNRVVMLCKEWIDDKGRDNTRPETIDMTIKSPYGGSRKYTLKTDGGVPEQGSDGRWHSYYYSEEFYVPSYVNFADFEITEAEITTGSYTETKTYIAQAQAGTLPLKNGVYILTLTNTLDQNRKTVTVGADKLWKSSAAATTDSDVKWWAITRPAIKYVLQYKTQSTISEEGAWTDVTDAQLNPANANALVVGGSAQSAQITKQPDLETDYTHTWTNLKKYWDNPGIDGKPEIIEYRVKEVILPEDKDSQANWYNHYSKSNKSSTEEEKKTSPDNRLLSWTFTEERNDYGVKADGTADAYFRNNLFTRTPYVKKQWTATNVDTQATEKLTDATLIGYLVDLGAIPESLKFTVEYQVEGDTTWTKVPVKPTTTQQKVKPTGNNGEAVIDTVTLATETESKGTALTGMLLPSYNKDGKKIIYRVRETAIKYKNSSVWVDVTYDSSNKGTSADYSISVNEVRLTGTQYAVTFTNDYKYVNKSVEKIWVDEGNRDDSRTNFKFNLYRDGSVYGTADTSTDDVTAATKAVLDKSICTVTRDNASNIWKIEWKYLPYYKAGAQSASDASVYTWVETVAPTDYAPEWILTDEGVKHWNSTSKTYEVVSEGLPAIGTEAFKYSNTYQPERYKLTATKNWQADYDDAFGTRPSEIWVKLQYKVDDDDPWADVEQGTLAEGVDNKTIYKKLDGTDSDPSKAYTTTDLTANSGWFKLEKDASRADGAWTSKTWENLPHYAAAGETITYRVIEGTKSGSTFTPIENGKKLNNYTVTYATVNFDDKKDENTEVKNTLDTTTLLVSKVWAGDTKYVALTRPASVTFTVEYKKAGEAETEWRPLPAKYCSANGITPAADGKTQIVISGTTAKATWSKTLSKLPYKDADGTQYQYRVTEASIKYADGTVVNVTFDDEAVSPYDGWIAGPYDLDANPCTATFASNRYTVTATNTLRKGSYKVTKVWWDEDDRDGFRDEIHVGLYRKNGTAEVLVDDTGILNAANNWTYTWSNLAVRENNGTDKVTYLVKELKYDAASKKYVPITGSTITLNGKQYDVTYNTAAQGSELGDNSPYAATGAEVANSYQPQRGSISVTKSWEDYDNKYDTREDVFVQLQFKDKNDEWKPVTKEALVTIPGDATTGKTYYAKLTSGGAFDYWLDIDKAYTTSDVKDSAVSGNWFRLTKDLSPAWSHTWDNLPVYRSNGTKIEYRVVEGKPDYDASPISVSEIADGGKLHGYTVTYSDSVKLDDPSSATAKEATVTNTLITGSIKVSKIMQKDGTALTGSQIADLIDEGLLPDKFTVSLYRGTSAAALETKDIIWDADEEEYSTVTFTNLPIYEKGSDTKIKYKVTDAAGTGFPYIVCGTTSNITIDTDNEPYETSKSITNNYVSGKLKITKAWDDEENRDLGRTDIRVQLYRNGAEYGDVVTLEYESATASNKTYTWTDLPVYSNGTTEKYTYTVKELDAYDDPIEAGSDFTGDNNVKFKVTYSDGVELTPSPEDPDEFTITNTHNPEKGKVIASKVWDDNDDEFDNRPETITYTLQYSTDNGTNWTAVPGEKTLNDAGNYEDEGVYTTSKNSQTIDVPADKKTPCPEAEWENLPLTTLADDGTAKDVTYRVVETTVAGYTTSYYIDYTSDPKVTVPTEGVSVADKDDKGTDVTIVVENKALTEGLTITKTWDATGVDTSLIKPVEVTFHAEFKLANGGTWADMPSSTGAAAGGLVTITEKDGIWTATLVNLPKPNDKFVYRVSEASVKYQVKNAAGSWVDVTYNCTGAFDADNKNWTGSAGFYAASVAVSRINAETWQAAAVNTAEPGAIEIFKEWDDEDNRDLSRPNSTGITLQLYKLPAAGEGTDAIAIGEPKTLTIADQVSGNVNRWYAIWNNLPKYNYDGTAAKYYVVEEAVDKYTTAYDGSADPKTVDKEPGTIALPTDILVENTHKPDYGTITASKVWDDFEDALDTRPVEIKFHLEYSLDGGVTFEPITKAASAPYANGDVYTTSDPVQTITYTGSKADPWTQKAEWKDLPLYAAVKDASGKT
ncbi:MAG: Cna B-type domain-containing protein, partial [Parasporobacterium sp.]|nr:Cna B-type domain-containing protein [Parasporobacterium sp.]